MDIIAPMPDREKFQHALEMVHLYQKHVLPYVEQHLDYAEMHILRAIGAHASIARALLYKMQWMTPLEITHIRKEEVACAVADCRLLLIPGFEHICWVDCQNVGTAYTRKAYHLKRVTSRSNHGCTITLALLSVEQDQ